MLRPDLVLFIYCVVVRVAQTAVIEKSGEAEEAEDNLDCGPNEEIKCVGCPPEDSCYDQDDIVCPRAFLPCHPACVCKEGFIRKTLDTECIPKGECGVPICGQFEQLTNCKECSNDTCSSIGSKSESNCTNQEECTPGCACWLGFYRADENSPCQHSCHCNEMGDTPGCPSLVPLLG